MAPSLRVHLRSPYTRVGTAISAALTTASCARKWAASATSPSTPRLPAWPSRWLSRESKSHPKLRIARGPVLRVSPMPRPEFLRLRSGSDPRNLHGDVLTRSDAYNIFGNTSTASLTHMAAIEILGLEKTYMVGFWRKRPKRALQPLHLTVEEGEIFGFLGPNGAGKTTTLKMLMGLVFPTSGTARILGHEWTDPAIKAQIGFLPEQPYFYDYLTAHELLDYYGQLSGVPGKDRKRRIEEVLQRVGLTDIKGVQLRKFSKGMLQRAGIAQAILHNPKLVFFDEPMSGLDPLGRREVRDLMEQLKQEGKTVFFSTHILSDAEALCDRVAIINKGELRGVGAVEDLTSTVQGKVEVVWQGTIVPASMKALGADCHVTGDTVRAVLPENQQDAAIDALRRERIRLIAITPLRTSLEAYFVEKMQVEKLQQSQTAGKTV